MSAVADPAARDALLAKEIESQRDPHVAADAEHGAERNKP
jgi:hypothetical protein